MTKLTLTIVVVAVFVMPFHVSAQAPTFIPVQGFLTDSDGVPVDGETNLRLALHASSAGGTALFEEIQVTLVDDGFFTVYMGAIQELDLSLFRDHGSLFLGITVNDEAEMAPRLVIGTAPFAGFAEYAGDAQSLNGLAANDFRAAADAVDWTDLSNVPGELTDGDSDSLAALTCSQGQVIRFNGTSWSCSNASDTDTLAGMSCDVGKLAKWNGTAWVCSDDLDTHLTEAEVEGYITNAAIDLAVDSTVAGAAISTGPHTTSLGWLDITSRPAGLDDGDDNTQLTDAEVDFFATNGPIDLAVASTMGGIPISTGPHTTSLDWLDITSRPAGLDDGDDDTHLTEAEVEGYITNGDLDMNGNTITNLTDPVADSDVSTKAYVDTERAALEIRIAALEAALKGATYRWAVWSTYNQAGYWYANNDASLFGGVNPSNWGDGNARADMMSSSSDILRTLFVRKGPAIGTLKNVNVYAEEWRSYSSTNSKHVAALFRVRNNTGSDIDWTVYWFHTGYGGWNEWTSIAVNGANTWSSSGTHFANYTSSHALTIPADRTSTVIFVASSTAPVGDMRACFMAFYNDSLILPAGLEFVDDLDTKPDGWDN